ncbi:hypothetical protein EDB19DRAFT_235779 [Suillus lakei]|nr:hypothetical protein EDB19DRAFT_235779 [Suillus lakei]
MKTLSSSYQVSSFDSGSEISKYPMETGACVSYEEIESQLLDLPDDWKPPSHPFARFCFTQLCLITVGKPALEELWQDVVHKDCWYECVMRMDDRLKQFLAIMLTNSVYFTCIVRLDSGIKTADHSSRETYEALMELLIWPYALSGSSRWLYIMIRSWMKNVVSFH